MDHSLILKNNTINLVATDTKRLAIVKIEQENDHDFSLIIPKKAISEIQKLFFDSIEIFEKYINCIFFTIYIFYKAYQW